MIRALDKELARFGKGAGRIRLRIGEALDRLVDCSGHHSLGFPTLEAYARERCERPGRWASESRSLAKRLLTKDDTGLPRIREALRRGSILWSMAELLARNATADNEEALLKEASTRTVRQMKEWLRDEHPEPEPKLGLRVEVGETEVAMLEASRKLVAAINGSRPSDDDFVDALLAEGFSSISGDPWMGISNEGVRQVRAFIERRDTSGRKLRRELAAEAEIPRVEADEVDEPLLDPPLPLDALGLDAEIRGLCLELARRELELGRLARKMSQCRGYRHLGYGSFEQYARERVGCSASSLKHKMTLARRCDEMPAIGSALQAGRVGYEAAMLVGRIATPDNVGKWLERARVRTIKHLREDVEAVELRTKFDPSASIDPPTEDELEDAKDFERKVLTGELLKKTVGKQKNPRVQMSVSAGGGREVRFRLSAEVIEHFERVQERFYQYAPAQASFLAFLCLSLWQAWLPAVKDNREVHKESDVYEKDNYQCSNPVCTGRLLHAHHLEFLGLGGPDTLQNKTSLCEWCHLLGIHEGRIKADPPSSNIRWVLGRAALLVVQGRERKRTAATTFVPNQGGAAPVATQTTAA